MNLLARREHSVVELTRKLSAKSFDKNIIQTVIDALCQEGLINERRFIENYIYYRQKKGFGPLRIQAELKERGISMELIEEMLDITDNAWLLEARRVREKKFKKSIPTDFKSRAREMRFLQYRGFTQEQIEKLFHED